MGNQKKNRKIAKHRSKRRKNIRRGNRKYIAISVVVILMLIGGVVLLVKEFGKEEPVKDDRNIGTAIELSISTPKKIDESAIEDLREQIKTIQLDVYTEESVNELNSRVEYAEEVLKKEPTQKKVEEMYLYLKEGILGLTKKEEPAEE